MFDILDEIKNEVIASTLAKDCPDTVIALLKKAAKEIERLREIEVYYKASMGIHKRDN